MLITPQSDSQPIRELRRLKHLAVVDVELMHVIGRSVLERSSDVGRQWMRGLETWRRELISLLKDSPSTERKFLRWKITISHLVLETTGNRNWVHAIMANEELEVFPDTPL